MTRRHNPFRSCLLAWAMALLAVFIQISGASALPECCDPAQTLTAALCGVDHAPAPQPHRHDQDCAACPLCASAAVQVVLADPGPGLPLPVAFVAVQPFAMPPARAPPSAPYHPGRPRGPPILA